MKQRGRSIFQKCENVGRLWTWYFRVSGFGNSYLEVSNINKPQPPKGEKGKWDLPIDVSGFGTS
jgi:hypothetical protein